MGWESHSTISDTDMGCQALRSVRRAFPQKVLSVSGRAQARCQECLNDALSGTGGRATRGKEHDHMRGRGDNENGTFVTYEGIDQVIKYNKIMTRFLTV